VLPWTLQFFIDWSMDIKLPAATTPLLDVTPPLFKLPKLEGDPAHPGEMEMWFNRLQKKIKINIDGGIAVIHFQPTSLIAPHISLDDYIDMVVMMLLVFGLSFQLPLVVMALAKIGIVDLDLLKKSRRVVYFALVIAAAVITPGDVITATIALTVPLILLYELGIFLARPSTQTEGNSD